MAAAPSASLLLLLLAFSCACADITVRDDRCLMLDSCYFRTDTRTCGCDADCHLYGTCCAGVPQPPSSPPLPAHRCYGRRTRTPLYVVRSCPPDVRDYDLAACTDDDEDEMDVLGNLLVTNSRTKVTYWNKHCAKCNKEDLRSLEFWDIVVQCELLDGVDKGFVRRHLTFDHDALRWGLKVGGDFTPCVVHYAPPASLEEIKYCNPNLIQTCPPDYPDRERARKCAQAYAERKLKSADVYFRNVHCAICNGLGEKEVECTGMSAGPEDSADESDFREVTEVVFSGGEWLPREPGRLFECSPGYAYDPYRGKCRTHKAAAVAPNSASLCGKESFLLLATFLVLVL